MKILIVDDNADQCASLKYLLHACEALPNYTVSLTDSAGTLKDALALIASKPYDCVLLDLTLPDSKGVDTLKKVVEAAPSLLAVVVITGHDDKALMHQCIDEGAQDYLVKGLTDPEVLCRSVAFALSRQRWRALKGGVKALSLEMQKISPISGPLREIADGLNQLAAMPLPGSGEAVKLTVPAGYKVGLKIEPENESDCD